MLKIVKNIVDGIKLNVEYFKSIKDDNDDIFFRQSEITEGGYIIRHNTTKLLQNNASACLCTIIDFGEGKYIPCLYTDGMFKMLSKETQEFIIQHEMGHFNYHLNLLIGDEPIKRNIDLEHQADEYAMEQIGYSKAINGLIEIKEMGIKMQYGFGKFSPFTREINKRIKHLMEVNKANNN